MTLSDKVAYRQIIGSLMQSPLLFIEYPDISPYDFVEAKVDRACFIMIKKMYDAGAKNITVYEVDQEFEKQKGTAGASLYFSNNGLEYLKTAFEFAEPRNFKMYYNRLKKYSLLYQLKKAHYDISDFYIEDKDINDPLAANEIQERCDNASLEDIITAVEGRFNEIRNEFVNGGRRNGDPSEDIFHLIQSLQESPNVGPDLEGHIFNAACRGAREGCFFLKSASTNAGKSRTSVFDACRLAYPERWSHEKMTFIHEINFDDPRQPRKVLFIVTEMDVSELQTIMLAYLSGVDEAHILTGRYEPGELLRVKYAATIMKKYQGYFLIEEISEPTLINIEATIKKYATIDKVKYIFFDYIHTTAGMLNQFAKNSVREEVVLMLMANQLKQLAKDYNVFIFSATQVNAKGMEPDGEFKDESCIRGAKSVADKCDAGFIMTKVDPKFWDEMIPKLRQYVREGIIEPQYIDSPDYKPTHVIDIYKMRRGRYRGVRIWSHIHLGTGRRVDLFMTTSNNMPISWQSSAYTTMEEEMIGNWREQVMTE